MNYRLLLIVFVSVLFISQIPAAYVASTTEPWEAISYEGGTKYSSTGTTPIQTSLTQPIKTIMFRDDNAHLWYNFITFKNITDTLIINPRTNSAISHKEGTIYSPILRVEYSRGTTPTQTLPIQPIKTIMFRVDDAQPRFNFITFKNITDTLIINRIPQTISVIPYSGRNSIGNDTTLKTYLNTIKNYDTVELALNGYMHTVNEFGYQDQAEEEARISNGLAIFKSELNLVPVTFIPPYHEYNTATVNAAKNKGLTRFSTGLYNDNYPWQENPSGLLHVPVVSEFYDWDVNRPRTYDQITSDCQISLEKYNACVILLHTGTFNGSAVVDPVKYKTLLDVINWTHKKESEGVKLVTIKQYVR
jgi:hypothetical protein